MTKQLSLFPELTTRVVSNLDEESLSYAKNFRRDDSPITREDVAEAYKEGASMVLGEIIDLLKKYTDLHES